MVVHTFNLNTQGNTCRLEYFYAWEARLIYIVSSRPAKLHSESLSQKQNKQADKKMK